MLQNFIKVMLLFFSALSLNVTALENFSSSDYSVESGDSVTLTFYDFSPSRYWPQAFNIYVTKPGSSSRVAVQTGVTGNTITTTLFGAGTHYFEAEVCDTDTGDCGSESSLQINVTPSSLPKPVINIDYPSGIYARDTFTLEVTTMYAVDCTIKYAANGTPQPFGNYLKVERLTYGSPGTYVQTVACDGPGGSSTENHTVRVFSQNPPAGPQIRSFLNGDVINGQSTLFWSSINTDRCTLNNGRTTATVGTSGINYPVSIPFGGLTFTLSCFQGSASVSRELYVPRPPIRRLSCDKHCDLSINVTSADAITENSLIEQDTIADNRKIFVGEHYNELNRLGIDLSAPEVTFNSPDLNDDGYVDLVVYMATQQRAYVLISKNGIFDSIDATAKGVSDRLLINSIHVDGQGKVILEIAPNIVIDQ
ncbi:hypothetical protein [Agarilytica rhodophyticola]|uniref:hypothetical protein n=1 Tax=Agarilytica rhodophyticola TaxID=1737490 RepID=UPI000B343B64|nr:hypothetical protein [Agarilytica rhodophyticola]